MPNICHMPKLLNIHQWGNYANIYATYEFTGINHILKSTVQGWQWYQHWQWWWCRSTALAELAIGQFSQKLCSVWQSTHTHTHPHKQTKLLNMHLWGKYANTRATYEVAPINDVARIAVPTRRRWHRTTTPKPDYVYWVGHWPNQQKKKNEKINFLLLWNVNAACSAWVYTF